MRVASHVLTRSLSVLAAISLLPAMAGEPPNLIPKPARAEWREGFFELTAESRILHGADESATVEDEAQTLAAMLRPATGFPFPVDAPAAGRPDGSTITMLLEPARNKDLGKEGYALTVSPEEVRIVAAAPAGLLYAGQTLRQLLPPVVYAASRQNGVRWRIPCCHIEDVPRFAWRGFMLDYSRHFFDVTYTKHLLDAMAMNKLNLLHMHLTDDDGWRVEIKKYPKLTEIGAWRGTDCPLPNTRKGETFKRYGGFFTQKQIRDLVAYAARLHINVMPEIDLPGHALAICTAYPGTLPTRLPDSVSVQGHKANAISPARASNYRMVEDILGEIAALFPFDYIHIGGDEVNHSLWKECPEIKAFMQKESIGSLHGAQVYFTKRLEGILAGHNKKMIGWNEILNGDLRRTTAIMSWIGTGPGYHAARMGFPVVMAPGPHTYFDMSYPRANDEPPSHWWAGPVGSARCYSFDPLGSPGLNEEQARNLIGVQACLWSEYITPWASKSGWTEFTTAGEHADYKIFPRLCALAEMGWTPQEERNFPNFANRLGPTHLRRLKAAGVTFRTPTPDAVLRKGSIHLLPPFQGATIRYTLDGSDPFRSATAVTWDGKPFKGNPARLRARTDLDGQPSPLHAGARLEAIGTWDKNSITPAFEVQEFDVTGILDEPGIWRIGFRKTGGKQHVAVQRVELRVDGRRVAEDAHEGGSTRKSKYRFDLTDPISPNARVLVRVAMKVELGAETKVNTAGELTLEKSESLEPKAVATSTISHYGNHVPAHLVDYDRATIFWSNRPVRKGESVTITFARPVAVSSIECVSGKRNDPTQDILLNGVLEVSADGREFRKAATFSYGTARAHLNREKVLAVRILATADHVKNWLVLQDLQIK